MRAREGEAAFALVERARRAAVGFRCGSGEEHGAPGGEGATLAAALDGLDPARAIPVIRAFGLLSGDAAGLIWTGEEADSPLEAVDAAVADPSLPTVPPNLALAPGLRAREAFIAALGEETDSPGEALGRGACRHRGRLRPLRGLRGAPPPEPSFLRSGPATGDRRDEVGLSTVPDGAARATRRRGAERPPCQQ